MSRFELVTLVHAPPERVFDASLSVEAHTASMSASRERAVAGVTSGRLAPTSPRPSGRWARSPSCSSCAAT
ncbi:hypothetical protein ACFXJ8_40250 [Nonomuraea sp. NPDC059194]|uniref:hypothetical protein n=1 Tax=Nonomuraea sp. NPDC059194 TaxID=3346764 RepID=UPI00368FC24D